MENFGFLRFLHVAGICGFIQIKETNTLTMTEFK